MITKTYITRTFFDIYPDEASWNADADKLRITISSEDFLDLYYLIAGRYGDSNIRYTNENLFKLNLFNEIGIHYPTVLAIIREQSKLRETDDEELSKLGKMVVNTGDHNTADLSLDTEEGIAQLDSQGITLTSKGKLSVILDKLDYMKSGAQDKFLQRLVRLFVQIISPQRDLLYITEKED